MTDMTTAGRDGVRLARGSRTHPHGGCYGMAAGVRGQAEVPTREGGIMRRAGLVLARDSR